jgi:hypothetical protein
MGCNQGLVCQTHKLGKTNKTSDYVFCVPARLLLILRDGFYSIATLLIYYIVSGWIEVFPCRKTNDVTAAKKLLENMLTL